MFQQTPLEGTKGSPVGGAQRVTLLVSLGAPFQPVSALSSFLRTLQAAVRDAAQAAPEAGRGLAAEPRPVLLVSAASGAGAGFELTFYFANPDTGAALDKTSAAVFQAFFDAIESAVKARPQRTLWGDSARLPSATAPQIRPSPRIEALLDEIRRFRAVVLQHAGRRIAADGSSMQIAPRPDSR